MKPVINTLKRVYRPLRRAYQDIEDRKVARIKTESHQAILQSAPVQAGGPGLFGLHIISCEEDFDMSLWALKTFYHYSRTTPKLVVHDDGSLSAESKDIYRRHFTGCEIVERAQADPDIIGQLKHFPECQLMRRNPRFYCSLKLFDSFHFCESEYILHLDTDMLFFQHPEEMIRYMESGKPFFMSDYQNAYSYDLKFLRDKFCPTMNEHANAGLFYMRVKDHFEHMRFIEEYFRECQRLNHNGDPNRHEQTLNMMIVSRLHGARLSPDYQISNRKVRPQTAMHHYVNDGSRKLMFLDGMKLLHRQKFLEILSEF